MLDTKKCPDCHCVLEVRDEDNVTYFLAAHDAEFCRKGVLIMYRAALAEIDRLNRDVGILRHGLRRSGAAEPPEPDFGPGDEGFA